MAGSARPTLARAWAEWKPDSCRPAGRVAAPAARASLQRTAQLRIRRYQPSAPPEWAPQAGPPPASHAETGRDVDSGVSVEGKHRSLRPALGPVKPLNGAAVVNT